MLLIALYMSQSSFVDLGEQISERERVIAMNYVSAHVEGMREQEFSTQRCV